MLAAVTGIGYASEHGEFHHWHREFVDGSRRDVYQDDDGRQFVIDDDGEAIHGNWFLTPELEAMTPLSL